MPRHVRLLISIASASALAAGTLAVTGPTDASPTPDGVSAALSRLRGDASGALSIRAARDGRVTFVGVPAGVSLDDPRVTSSTSVADAAQSAVDRYGAAFGATQQGTTLRPTTSNRTVVGDVVRYQQDVGGVPVLGGELVVSLGADRQLSSVLAETSRVTSIPDALVGEGAARATAVQAFLRASGQGGDPDVASMGRWVLDPSLVDLSSSTGTRGAWRFEVRRGVDERRMVLVDDLTGAVLLDVDLVQHALDRIVCDNAEVTHAPQPDFDEAPCTDPADAARVEGGGASGVADVNSAYDLSGAVSSTYAALGVDLTQLIGRSLTGSGAGTKALSSTVRMCYTSAGGGCPYQNAFWNGKQMYYGTGYAGADDVVGHEMTHGVTERTSGLLYWGQSGAMNESISDIMGEIVDHQHVNSADAVPGNVWAFGEDLPGAQNGGLRNLRDPTIFGNPDRTSSPLWVREDPFTFSDDFPTGYPDQDGVHSNSGVGNKTFYLISQGGTFNGQTIKGIDGADPNLFRSAKLWLLTDQTLSSGSDYADEAVVLEQSCAALQKAGVVSGVNCEAVHRATLATELRETPINAAQPRDALLACPNGFAPRALFDSESGDPATKFLAGPTWSRAGLASWGPNAHSKPASWASEEPSTIGASSLVTASGISLPAGRPAYLWFQQWRVLDYDYAGTTYDAGTVEVDDTGDAAGPVDVAGLPWVNGPENPIISPTNPAAGRKGFGTDSRGYLASRLDLSVFAGRTIKPQFTMNTDAIVSIVGWYVDDIVVYTCDPKVRLDKVILKGRAVVGHTLTAKLKGLQRGATVTFKWLRNGKRIKGATHKRYLLKGPDRGTKVSVLVTASAPGHASTTLQSRSRTVLGRQHR